MSRPWTTEYTPSLQVHGKLEIRPSGTPYEPSLTIAMLTQSPSGVPSAHVRMWSMAAFAADAADDAPRASMIAAPRLATVGMKVPSTQSWSPTSSYALFPPTWAWKRSGYWVVEWLPQMVIFVTSVTGTPSFWASWLTARLWSSRVIAVNCPGSRSGALRWAISALVLAGLPTTRTLTSRLALELRALPCGRKMPPLADSRSLRSMPALRGMAPTRSA